MKQAISTSVEQSRRLLACGVDPKTADMVWLKAEPPFLSLNRGCNRAIPEVGDVPAWSLSSLMDLFDKNISVSLTKHFGFYAVDSFKGMQIAATPIEACVALIEDLTANGYSLNKIEE